jgi:hypothetical protein
MPALLQLNYLQIADVDGRNLSESAKQALPLFPHLYAGLMEKLLPR